MKRKNAEKKGQKIITKKKETQTIERYQDGLYQGGITFEVGKKKKNRASKGGGGSDTSQRRGRIIDCKKGFEFQKRIKSYANEEAGGAVFARALCQQQGSEKGARCGWVGEGKLPPKGG